MILDTQVAFNLLCLSFQRFEASLIRLKEDGKYLQKFFAINQYPQYIVLIIVPANINSI
jgi:hypothetical protein